MKKNYILILLILLSNNNLLSQARTCGSITNVPYLQQASPSDYQSIMNLEAFIQDYIATVNNVTNTARLISPNATIIIPVVVHVLHRGEAVGLGRNISDAQIQSQITGLQSRQEKL